MYFLSFSHRCVSSTFGVANTAYNFGYAFLGLISFFFLHKVIKFSYDNFVQIFLRLSDLAANKDIVRHYKFITAHTHTHLHMYILKGCRK